MNPHPKETSANLPKPPELGVKTQSRGKAVTSHGKAGTSPALDTVDITIRQAQTV
jgi:hypothetical protein